MCYMYCTLHTYFSLLLLLFLLLLLLLPLILQRLGVVSVLHCKKLRLAVEDELADAPTALSTLDHHWVAG